MVSLSAAQSGDKLPICHTHSILFSFQNGPYHKWTFIFLYKLYNECVDFFEKSSNSFY